MKQYTLVFPITENTICLGYKKRGFGHGNWNGFGGKIQDGESEREAAIRELNEESCIQGELESLEKVARIEFFFKDGAHLEVHVFLIRSWRGDLTETEEMKPVWFHFSDIPYKEM